MHEYNTKKDTLILKEYGRNIQKLIKLVTDIEDKDERTKKARMLIRVMKSVNPKVRGILDDSRKLWDDLFIMSDYKLDIDSPYPMPQKDMLKKKISRLPYKNEPLKFKHYGRNLELFVQQITKETDSTLQEELLLNAARIMKNFNTSWNNDNSNIDAIINDLTVLLGDNFKFDREKIKHQIESRMFNRPNNTLRYKTSTTNNYGAPSKYGLKKTNRNGQIHN